MCLIDAKRFERRQFRSITLSLAQNKNLPKRRGGEVLELVGLTDVAARISGTKVILRSALRQRLGIAGTRSATRRPDVRRAGQHRAGPGGKLWIANSVMALELTATTPCSVNAKDVERWSTNEDTGSDRPRPACSPTRHDGVSSRPQIRDRPSGFGQAPK